MIHGRQTCLCLRFLFACAALSAQAAVGSRVVINELMYHPASDDETQEFLELFNAGDAPADMAGWSLADGIAYVFPAGTILPVGGYLVLSPDPAAYANAYPSAKPALGPYAGQLSNGGERLRLLNNAGVTADEMTYSDDPPWPSWPDGGGSSLELLSPLLDNALSASWQAPIMARRAQQIAQAVASRRSLTFLRVSRFWISN